jgi:hypothetical protein
MIGRVLERILDAQSGWAKPLGDWVHRLAAATFGRMLPIRDFLAGTWLGHPLHALLTDMPIGALTLVIILDVVGQPAAADVALLLGILACLPRPSQVSPTTRPRAAGPACGRRSTAR